MHKSIGLLSWFLAAGYFSVVALGAMSFGSLNLTRDYLIQVSNLFLFRDEHPLTKDELSILTCNPARALPHCNSVSDSERLVFISGCFGFASAFRLLM